MEVILNFERRKSEFDCGFRERESSMNGKNDVPIVKPQT